MSHLSIAHERLLRQYIATPTFKTPLDVVSHMGAVQAQDYLGSLWAIGLRMEHATEVNIEDAVRTKSIIRTWPMRGTLHFVASRDARWMLSLMTPRIVAGSLGRFKQLGLDDDILARARRSWEHALRDGPLARTEMYAALESAGISTAGYRALHLLGRLAQEQVICFGPRQGKQHTFALFDQWVPPTTPKTTEESLGEITVRYFTSHGPATIQDMGWWSGLTVAHIKQGIAIAGNLLESHTVEGTTYYTGSKSPSPAPSVADTYLLPPFDEYLVAYRNRDASLQKAHAHHYNPGANGMLSAVIVQNGQVVGTWKRSLKKQTVSVQATPFSASMRITKTAYEAALARYTDFLNLN